MEGETGQLELFPTANLVPAEGVCQPWRPFGRWQPDCILRFVWGARFPEPWRHRCGCYVLFQFPRFRPIYYVGKTGASFGKRFRGHYANPADKVKYGRGCANSIALFRNVQQLPPLLRAGLGLALFSHDENLVAEIVAAEENMKDDLHPLWNRDKRRKEWHTASRLSAGSS